MSLLLVGGDSEIGSAASQHLGAENFSVLSTTRRQDRVSPARPFLDLVEPLGSWEPPTGVEAACILAGIPRIVACHRDPIGTARVNVDQTLHLVSRLLERDIYVLFLSTNQVFDGAVPLMPADAAPSPVSHYGQQKAAVEVRLRAAMADGARAAVLRFAKVVTPPIALLQGWALELAAGRPVCAFFDMVMAPTPVTTAVAAIRALMTEQARGIYQLTGPRDVSYAEVAFHIAAKVGAARDLVRAVPTASTGGSVPAGSTPRFTTLDSSALRERWGIAAPEPWTVIDTLF